MLIKNSILYGIATVIRGVFSFLLIAIFTRLLSPADYGDYAVITALIGFTDSFAFLWIRCAVMRHITHHPAPGDAPYLTNAMIVYLGVSAVCIVVSYVLFNLGIIDTGAHKMLYDLLGLLIVTEGLSNLALVMARIRLQHKMFFVQNVLKPFLSVIIGAGLVWAGWGTYGATLGLLAASLASCAAGFFGTRDFRAIQFSLFDKKILHDILRFGLPLVLVLALQSAMRTTDRLLLETLIGGDVTGLYAAAQDIPYRLLNIAMMAVHLAAYPLAVQKLDHEGPESCRAQLKSNYLLLLGIGLPSAAGMAMLAPALAAIFTGPAFRPFVTDYLGVFSALAFVNCFLQYYFILSFNFVKKTNVLVAPFLGALAVNAAAGYVLVLKMGAVGAIIASSFAYIFLAVAVFIMGQRLFRVPVPAKETWQIAAATAAMTAAVSMFHPGTGIMEFLLTVVLGGMVYAAAILLFNTGGIRRAIADSGIIERLSRKVFSTKA